MSFPAENLPAPDGLSKSQREEIGARIRIRPDDLPLWALVLFACRCARRVSSLYFGPKKHLFRKAIRLAESAAAAGTLLFRDEAVDGFWKFYEAESHAATGGGQLSESYYAAAAAFSAYVAAAGGPAATCAIDAAEQAARALAAWEPASPSSMVKLWADTQSDLRLLKELAKKHGWNSNTAVPGSVLPRLRTLRCSAVSDAACNSLVIRVHWRDGGPIDDAKIVLQGGTGSLRERIAPLFDTAIRGVLNGFQSQCFPAGNESSAAFSELLSEKALCLLRSLSRYHCTIDLTTWCGADIHRSNARKYAYELRQRGLVARNSHRRYVITRAGRDHLDRHPHHPPPDPSAPAKRGGLPRSPAPVARAVVSGRPGDH